MAEGERGSLPDRVVDAVCRPRETTLGREAAIIAVTGVIFGFSAEAVSTVAKDPQAPLSARSLDQCVRIENARLGDPLGAARGRTESPVAEPEEGSRYNTLRTDLQDICAYQQVLSRVHGELRLIQSSGRAHLPSVDADPKHPQDTVADEYRGAHARTAEQLEDKYAKLRRDLSDAQQRANTEISFQTDDGLPPEPLRDTPLGTPPIRTAG